MDQWHIPINIQGVNSNYIDLNLNYSNNPNLQQWWAAGVILISTQTQFPLAKVFHLNIYASDHMSILLDIDHHTYSPIYNKRPKRFEQI